MSYKNTFRQTVHFVYNLLDDELKAVIDVVGELFDDIRTALDIVLAQVDPYQLTTDGLLFEHEQFYGCVHSGTLAERRNRVIAAIRSKGGLSMSHFVRIAEALGYTIGTTGTKHLLILEGAYTPFRIGISQLDIDKIYDQQGSYSMYTVVVTGTSVESDIDLQYRFDRQRCAGVIFEYINS